MDIAPEICLRLINVGEFMSKKYSFSFLGTMEMFLNQLNKYSNNKKYFYLDDYIVDFSEDKLRFGIARGGHSGGYWFIPTITEIDNYITLCGTIKYIDHYTSEKGIKKIINKVEEIFALIILLPLIILIKLYFFFSWIVKKILKKPKSKEESLEDKLYN